MGLFSSIKGTLFGEKPKAEISPRTTLTPEQQTVLSQNLLPFLTGTPFEEVRGAEFPGQEGFQFTAPVSGAETTSLAALEQLALAGVQPGAGESFLTQLLSGGGAEQLQGFGEAGGGPSSEFLQSLFQQAPTGPLTEFLGPEEGARPGTEFLTSLFTEGADAFQVSGAGPLAQFFTPDAEGFDEFFELAIQQPLLEAFEEDIVPAITRRGAGTGNLFGSATRGNIERAQEELLGQLAQQRAGLGFQAREAGLSRALEAAGLAEQLQFGGFEAARGREVGAAGQVTGFEQAAGQSALDRALAAAGQIETGELQAAVTGVGAEEAGAQRELTAAQVSSQQQLEAALGAEGLDLDRAGLQLQTIAQNIQAQGLPREVQNQEIAAQYADFLRQEGLQDLRINQLLAAIGLPTLENIATVTPGTTGLVQSFLGGIGG